MPSHLAKAKTLLKKMSNVEKCSFDSKNIKRLPIEPLMIFVRFAAHNKNDNKKDRGRKFHKSMCENIGYHGAMIAIVVADVFSFKLKARSRSQFWRISKHGQFLSRVFITFFSQLGSCIHSGNKINIVTRNPILTMSLAHNCQYAVFNPDVMIHYRE